MGPPSGTGGNGRVDLALNVQPVFLVQVGPAGQIRTDLQHIQIIVKGLHLEPGGGDPGRLQTVPQPHLSVQIRGEEHQIRLSGKESLQVGLLVGAQIHGILRKPSPRSS